MKATDDRFQFRAWNKEWGEMVYSTTHHDWFEKRDFSPWKFDVGFSGYPKDDDWEYMQCMGKKDKNGKFIFDGDILKIEQPYRDYQDGPLEHRTLIGVISFDGGNYWFRGSGWAIIQWFHYESAELEVIGNIYQNPEILNEANAELR